jgi:transcriptional regulator with XRE-family HTH domain
MGKAVDKKALRKFGEHLSRLRKQKKLSLRELSYACNVDNSKISKIEKGKVNITFNTILQLAEALEVNVSELMDFE